MTEPSAWKDYVHSLPGHAAARHECALPRPGRQALRRPGRARAAPGAQSSSTGDLLTEVTKLTYDPNGNLTRRITPRGAAYDFNFAYDGADRLSSEQNPANETWSYGYDPAGNRTRETSPRGINQSTAYDVLGRPSSFTDLAGEETTFGYDANGNQTKVVAPGAAASAGGPEVERTTLTTYDGRDLPWQTTTGGDGPGGFISDARTTITEYDPNGNLRRTVNPAGVDAFRNPDAPDGSTSAAAENATVNTYSPDDLLVKTNLPWGNDDARDERRHQQTYERDGLGRVFAIRAAHRPGELDEEGDPGVPTVCYTHHENGWLKSSSDQKIRDIDPCEGDPGHLVNYDYDRAGNQTLWNSKDAGQSALGRKVTRSFFANGTLAQRRAVKTLNGAESSARTYNYYYNANRSLVLFFDQSNKRETAITRDPAEREQAVNERWGAGRDTLYAYDSGGNVARVHTDGTWQGGASYAGGKQTAFAYDTAEREETMTVTGGGGPSPRVTETDYHPSGEIATRDKARGSEETYSFSPFGEITRLDRDPGENREYAYDANGNRTKDERGTHTYNARDQLTSWDRDPSVPEGQGGNGDRVDHHLNGSGAIKRQIDHATEETTVNAYDGDRLESATTSEPDEPDTTTAFTYDDFGSIIRAEATAEGQTPSTTTYVYDEFERRTRSKGPGQTDDSIYCYDGLDRRDLRAEGAGGSADCESGRNRYEYSYVGTSENLSREADVGGANAKTYDYDSQGARQGQVKSGAYRAYRKDANGSVTGLEDENGEVPSGDAYDYDPYGELECGEETSEEEEGCEGVLAAPAKENPFRYEGFYYDSGVKTYDMRARSYRPEIGRFTSQDRYEQASSDLELQSDPLTQNRYAFAGGNPVTNVEFDGHNWEQAATYDKYGGGSRGAAASRRHARRSNQVIYNNPEGIDYSGGAGASASPDRIVESASALRTAVAKHPSNPSSVPAEQYEDTSLEKLRALKRELDSNPEVRPDSSGLSLDSALVDFVWGYRLSPVGSDASGDQTTMNIIYKAVREFVSENATCNPGRGCSGGLEDSGKFALGGAEAITSLGLPFSQYLPAPLDTEVQSPIKMLREGLGIRVDENDPLYKSGAITGDVASLLRGGTRVLRWFGTKPAPKDLPEEPYQPKPRDLDPVPQGVRP